MEHRPVDSSVIASVGYDAATSVLEIEFCNGGRYRYFLVAPSVHDALVGATSIGREFQSQIKDRYRAERVD